jgi:prepilin-type N-terminal cleavage/methylation domain-containing protein
MVRLARSSEKGFSMIEVAISVFLISIVIVSCMLFTGTSLKTSSTNRMKNNAIRLAQQTIENLKRYDQLNFNRNSLNTIPGIFVKQNSPPIDGITYTVETEIIDSNELDSSIRNDNNYIPIRVTVSWNYLGNHQISVDTFLIRWKQQ